MAAKGITGRMTSALPAPQPGSWMWPLMVASQKVNVWAYRKSGGRVGGRMDKAPVVILHTRGAKSGEPREIPLIGLRDGDDIVLVASRGGSPKNPAWYHNLRAHPEIEIEDTGQRRAMTARVADAAERARLWPQLTEIWPAYDDYQARAPREIPVIICAPRSP